MLDEKDIETTSCTAPLLADVPKSLVNRKWKRACLIMGLSFITIGVIGFSIFPTFLKWFIQTNMVLEEGKENYEKWKETPIPVTFKVFLYNITNPKEVKAGGKPHVEDIGPFTYEQYRSKDVLSFNRTSKTVTYDDKKRYHFLPEKSASLKSRILNVNLPLQGIIMFLRKIPTWAKDYVPALVEGIFSSYNETVFYDRTAEELLFKGYHVTLLEDIIGVVSSFAEIPKILPNNTFGFLYGKNNSGDGIFEVFTGEDDIGHYSQIYKWKNMSRIPFWNNQYCNMMNGTDGSQFPPPITKKDILYVYTPELCRSVSLEFEKEVRVKGIPAFRFVTPEKLFASPLDNPDNMCYCTEPEFCELSGILDVSPCREGLKLAVTGPHFFQGHQFIKDRVSGLKPSREEHETYVDIEPTTGLVLRASRKLQMNFIMKPYDAMEEFKHLAMSVIPLLWVIEEAEITDEVAALFTAKVRTPVTVAKSVLTACIVLGILWIVIAGFVTIYILVKEQKTAKAVIKSKYKVVPQKPEDILKSEKAHNVNA